jgi:hypothetical protein
MVSAGLWVSGGCTCGHDILSSKHLPPKQACAPLTFLGWKIRSRVRIAASWHLTNGTRTVLSAEVWNVCRSPAEGGPNPDRLIELVDEPGDGHLDVITALREVTLFRFLAIQAADAGEGADIGDADWFATGMGTWRTLCM